MALGNAWTTLKAQSSVNFAYFRTKMEDSMLVVVQFCKALDLNEEQ